MCQSELELILDDLEGDLGYYGFARQLSGEEGYPPPQMSREFEALLKKLLTMGVEVGQSEVIKKGGRDYTEFTAWTGTVNERVARARKEVEKYDQPAERSYAFCLCLERNVDRFEDR